jgi:hypothetical protein
MLNKLWSRRSEDSSIRISVNGSNTNREAQSRKYRTSKRTAYWVHEVSEEDFEEVKADSSLAFTPSALPPPSAIAGGPFSRRCELPRTCGDQIRAWMREWQLRELEMWPQVGDGLQPRNVRKTVLTGKPWVLSTIWEEEEEVLPALENEASESQQ